MKVGIVGSRGITDYEIIEYYVKFTLMFENVTHIISGGASGVDALAEEFAKKNRYKMIIYKADWNKYGRKAGFLRNIDIVLNSDIIIAFWDGYSKGTEHTINLCKKHNKKYYVYTV